MPGTAVQRTPQIKPQFITDFDAKETEVKDGMRSAFSTVNTAIDEDGTGGAGETVVKKSVKKTSKPDEEKIVKKSSATISDKIPKKTAQRAKGTTSLNKAIDKGSPERLDKTKAASGDKVPAAAKEECVEKPKAKPETRKAPADAPEKKPKTIPRKPGSKATKRPTKLPSPVPSHLTNETTVPDPPIPETPVTEGETTEVPTLEEKTKEEVEEPQPTTTASPLDHGISCSFFERLQLGVRAYFSARNSFILSEKNKKEGGNESRAVGKGVKEDAHKTGLGLEFKNSRCILESDLLFGQIPRKGYFYRSYMQFKIPGQPPPSPLELLEPCVSPKIKSKIEIYGLAPTGSEIARVPFQKRMKKKRKHFSKADMGPLHSDAESLDSSFSGSSNRSTSPKLFPERSFDNNRRGSAEKRRRRKKVTFADLLSDSRERERERRAIPEISFSADGQKKKKAFSEVGDDCFENTESGKKTPTTLRTLTNCITSVLGEDEFMENLEITPVNPESDKNLQNAPEEAKKPLIETVSISRLHSGSTFNPTAVLMGEIDLHLELQNYLKAFNNCTVSKTRTKNTIHSNNPIKRDRNEFRTEELLEGSEKTPSIPVREDPDHNIFDELEEERIESRLVRSQTQLPNVLKQMRKTKPTEKESTRTAITEKSIDSYEKIFPFGSQPPEELNQMYSSGESVPYESSTVEEPEKEKLPRLLLNLQDMVEIYRNVLIEYEKLRRRGRREISLSSHLVTLLNEKLMKKESRSNLLKLSKEMSNRQGLKRLSRRVESLNVQEYVSVFQKLLSSSMSIKQISRLNSIISGWESSSEECMKYVINTLEKAKARAAKAKARQNRIKKIQADDDKLFERLSSMESLTPLPKVNFGRQKPKAHTPPPSKNLQLMLESFFNSEGKDPSGLSHLKGKVLVDVKLTGSQIQVNDLSYLNSKDPPKPKTDEEGASELIIESVGNTETTDVFTDRPKTKTKKQIRKRAKPKPKKKKQKPIKDQKTTPPKFEYDENQLRSQHPIDPISECSECKIIEDKMASDVVGKKKTVDKNLLRKALENQFFLKEFMNSLKPSKTIGEMLGKAESYISNLPLAKLPVIMKAKPPKTVRSLVDLKTESGDLKKVHKTPSEWSRTFFCYSSYEVPDEESTDGGKNEMSAGGVVKTQKKMRDTGAVLKSPPPRPDDSTPRYKNGLTDTGSIDLLADSTQSKKRESQSGSMSNLIQDEEPEISINNNKSSIVFHTFNNSVDDRSFSLGLIHSDSFLKKFSHASILERDTKILFKNSSDIKFCPVRVTDSRKDAKPFLTFVLTPEQCEKAADLPTDDVVVIQRTKIPVVKPKPPPEDPPKAEKTSREFQSGLRSIEKFMDMIASASREAKKKKRKIKTDERKPIPPSFSDRKPKTRCQTCQLLSKQESQKRKKESKKVNFASRLTIKSDNKTQAKKVKSENAKSFFQKGAHHNVKSFRNVSEQKIKPQACEERKNEREKKSKRTTERVKNEERSPKAEEGENVSKMSVNLEEIPVELLEVLKNTFNQVDGFKKKKIISMIERDLEKRQVNGEKSGDGKNSKSFVLKIRCEKRDSLKKDEDAKGREVRPKKEIKMLDSFAIKEMKDEEEEDSTFFDAVEKSLKDDARGAGEEIKKSLKRGTHGSSTPKDKLRSLSAFTSDPSSVSHPSGKSEELILSQISDSLIEGQISYSLLMLDSFLKKKERFFSNNKGKTNNLMKLIQFVEEDTENLMTNLERSAWQKILVFLEALSQLVGENGGENLKSHLQSTKDVVHRILELNVSRLDDLKKFNSSVTQLANGNENEDDMFGVVKQCLTHFKQRFGTSGCASTSTSTSTSSNKSNHNNNNSRPPESDSRSQQITQVSHDELIKCSSNESVLSEIREMKNKLVEELKSLEKLFLIPDVSRSSSSVEEASSGVNRSPGGGTPSEDWLNRTYGCMHLMQCLMKVWDTRMSLNTYPNDYFR